MDSQPAREAFSRQAPHFDEDDLINPIVQQWRRQIYSHTNSFLKPGDSILELNAGTGIDAVYFASAGHPVLATDASAGMLSRLQEKISLNPSLPISLRQLAFEDLGKLGPDPYDYIFSNFGGLNCLSDLSVVTRELSPRVKAGGYATCVIMPPFCPWEIMRIFKGHWKEATRRFHKGGTQAHLEGSYFQTWYHSLSNIRNAFGPSFTVVRCEGLGVFSAPPAATRFYARFPRLNKWLRNLDRLFKDTFPFNRWGDHMIVTVQKSARA